MGKNPEVKRAKLHKAIVTDDVAALSLWGKKGAKKANEVKRDKKLTAAEEQAAEFERRGAMTNEDIVPIDDSPQGNAFTKPEYRHPDLE